MAIGGISFWQLDQNYWSQQKAQAQATSAETALMSVMSNAETSRETGLSSIANQEALNRVNKQISDAENALLGSSSGSTTTTPGSSPSPASSSPYATGIGTVPLTTGTSLSTLRIPPGGQITVSDGTNTTSYVSTGSDTIGDLMNALNANVPGNAYVTATLNSSGKLVIAGKSTTESVTVGGTFASAIGFGNGNTNFQPNKSATIVKPQFSSPPSSTASASTGKKDTAIIPASSINASAAASVLSASGVNGTLVDMLA